MNIRQFFDALGGTTAAGRLFFPRTRQPWSRGGDLIMRGYLPTHHWEKALRLAKARGIWLTTRDLMAWQSKARRRNPLKRGVEEGTLRDKAREGRKR